MQTTQNALKDLLMFSIKLFAVLLGLVLVITFSIFLYFGRVQYATSSEQRTMSVSGKAERKVKPDSASITVGIQSVGLKPAELQTQAATSIASFTAKVKALGLEESKVHTSQYYLNPTYQADQSIKDYMLTVDLTVTLEGKDFTETMAGKVLTAASEANLNTVKSLYYYLADMDTVTREMETEAVGDAKSLAQERAKNAGFSLGSVRSIQYDGGYPIMFEGRDVATSALSKESSVVAGEIAKLNPGELDIQKNVVIVYEIY